MRVKPFLTALCILTGGTGVLQGQEVRLYQRAGLYVPTRISLHDGAIQLRQSVGIKLGAGVVMRFGPRFDLVTAVTYLPGYAELRGEGKRIELATGHHRFGASVGGLYRMISPWKELTWELSGGLGMAAAGEGFDNLFESSSISAVVGTLVRYQFKRLIRLQMRIQERLGQFRLDGADVPGGKPFRLAFSVGFPFLESAVLQSVKPVSSPGPKEYQ